MIKITNNTGIDRKVLTVTQGAYENIYRKLGYVPFDQPDWMKQDGGQKTAEKTEDELFRESVEAKRTADKLNRPKRRLRSLPCPIEGLFIRGKRCDKQQNR